jgi:uncharacterized protein with NRDE domain
MCTVTFIPVNNKIIVTSNRDEKHGRLPAIAPAVYTKRTGTLLFPKDADAGGTWIAVHENGNMIVLLNGGLIKHEPKPPYKKSRGLVLIDLIDDENPYQNFLHADLKKIEPFTAIIFDEGQLFECRWDGEIKYHAALKIHQPHIWSSVTLYDDKIIRKRKKWFEEWLKKNPSPSQNDILHFHQFTGDGDKHNDLLMNRDGQVFTVSITSIEMNDENALMQYVDIRNQQTHQHELAFTKATASQ